MTPVQSSSIPLFLSHKDVVVEAVTGSGKTLAYILPLLEIIKREDVAKNDVGGLIITPTRELANQVHQVGIKFAEAMNISIGLFVGGTEVKHDLEKIQKGCQIMIGTPGRIHDILQRFLMKNFQVLILDEADRLLDMGFEKQIAGIISKLPKQRRTGLFSATMTEAVSQLVRAGLRNPVRVIVKVEADNSVQRTPTTLDIRFVVVETVAKISLLLDMLKDRNSEKIIVYMATCACVDYFYKALTNHPFLQDKTFLALHGKMDPKRRQGVFSTFLQKESAILLCTDVAARGLDVPDVDLVIQVDPPQDPKAFSHRCGRTARLGKQGQAIVFLTKDEKAFVDFCKVRKIPMTELKVSTENVDNVNDFLRRACLDDRDVYEKSIQAFVSYVRAYKEHQASYIFRMDKLDYQGLCDGFGLLQIPKMPELKGKNIVKRMEVDVDEIKFKDKNREKQRLNKPKKEIKIRPKKQEAWSENKAAKLKRLERREKKDKKRDAIHKARVARLEAEERKQDEDEISKDWKELKKTKK